MYKWCLNYESGEYENIDKDGFSIDCGELCIIGMIANIVERKKKREEILMMEKTIGKISLSCRLT